MPMPLSRLKVLILSDHYRYHGAFKPLHLLKDLWFNRGFKLTAAYRVAHFLYVNRYNVALKLFNLYYFNLQTRFCCELPYQTQIGPGLYFGHVFGTIINAQCQLGANVNLSHAVTLGSIAQGPRAGAPIIGDAVYLAPGAKLIGGIHIGSGTAIGANAVVTKDTPKNAVAVGIPAQVLSLKGSGEYIRHPVEIDRVDSERLTQNAARDCPV